MISKGIQNKYLKNKTIKTDRSPAISFTKLAIVMVHITSIIEKETPRGIFELLFINNIYDLYFKPFITHIMVGPAGFEPTTFRPPDGRATKLRYAPTENQRG